MLFRVWPDGNLETSLSRLEIRPDNNALIPSRIGPALRGLRGELRYCIRSDNFNITRVWDNADVIPLKLN